MKKNIVFLMLLASTVSFAQHFELGIKAGANISNFTGSSNVSDVKSSSLVGFHGGVFVSLFAGNNFAIQPEVLVGTQGAKIDNNGTKTDFKASYVNVPVMLKYRFNGGFYIEAGPQISFNIHSDYDGLDQNLRTTDLSLAGGIGYHSPIGLGIGVRYNAGLSKLGNFDASNVKPDYKNSWVQVSVFYTIFNHRK